MRIGIIVVRSVVSELEKEEILYLDDPDRPWLKKVTAQHSALDPEKKRRYTSCDYSTGYAVRHYHPQVQVGYIHPGKISLAEFAKYDLVFTLIYDLLESFYTDSNENFKKMEIVFQKSTNLYPPYNYQKFINSKCAYYTKFGAVPDVKVVPNYCVFKSEWNKSKDKVKYCASILKRAQKADWSAIFIKPLNGQEAFDASVLSAYSDPNKLCSLFEKLFYVYDGLVCQRFVRNFNENWEHRLYFINEQYVYTALTKGEEEATFADEEEGGTEKKPALWKKIMCMGENALKYLPDIVVKGKKLPSLINRVDIMDCNEAPHPVCVSEVEFVPSWYVNLTNVLTERMVAEQAVVILKQFLK